MLVRALVCILVVGVTAGAARADDRVDTTVTWFEERRAGGRSLTVVHPQFDLGFDLGGVLSLGAGYEADIVSGATPKVYAAPLAGQAADAVSGATQISDVRHVGKGALGFLGKRSSLTLAYVYGRERDYRSHSVTAAGSVDLPGKNTTFGLSYTHNFDSVCDYDNGDATPLERRALIHDNPCFTSDAAAMTVTRSVSIDTTQATVTQILSPTAVLQLGVFGQIIRGFQSNPYRNVRVAGVDAQEFIPDVRGRAALFARFNYAFPAIHSSAGLAVRGYADTWGVQSGTAELDYNQYLGNKLLFKLRGRYYQQIGAVFFRDARDYQTIGPAGTYFTGDRELGPLRTFLAGGKVSYLATAQEGRAVWGLFDEVDVHLKADMLWSIPLTDNPAGLDVTGPIPDSIVTQLGLLLRY